MRNSIKDLEKRLELLEMQLHPPLQHGVVWFEAVDRKGLAPGAKIVKDHYNDADGMTLKIRERITGDPSDVGWTYPHGRWNRKSFDKYNRTHPDLPIERVIWRESSPPEVPRKGVRPRAPTLGPADPTQSVPLSQNGLGGRRSPTPMLATSGARFSACAMGSASQKSARSLACTLQTRPTTITRICRARGTHRSTSRSDLRRRF